MLIASTLWRHSRSAPGRKSSVDIRPVAEPLARSWFGGTTQKGQRTSASICGFFLYYPGKDFAEGDFFGKDYAVLGFGFFAAIRHRKKPKDSFFFCVRGLA